jgi:hypothetical protein
MKLGFYRIEYENGMVQINELISKEDYFKYKELNSLKSDIEIKLKGKKEKNLEMVEYLKNINNQIKQYKPFFVVDSPMYNAIKTGILNIEDNNCGNYGKYPVKITKIDNFDDNLFDEIDV